MKLDFNKMKSIPGRQANPTKYFNVIVNKYNSINNSLKNVSKSEVKQLKDTIANIKISQSEKVIDFNEKQDIKILRKYANSYEKGSSVYVSLHNLATQLETASGLKSNNSKFEW